MFGWGQDLHGYLPYLDTKWVSSQSRLEESAITLLRLFRLINFKERITELLRVRDEVDGHNLYLS